MDFPGPGAILGLAGQQTRGFGDYYGYGLVASGKADIYHALQACLIPLFPATGSLTKVIPEAGGKY